MSKIDKNICDFLPVHCCCNSFLAHQPHNSLLARCYAARQRKQLKSWKWFYHPQNWADMQVNYKNKTMLLLCPTSSSNSFLLLPVKKGCLKNSSSERTSCKSLTPHCKNHLCETQVPSNKIPPLCLFFSLCAYSEGQGFLLLLQRNVMEHIRTKNLCWCKRTTERAPDRYLQLLQGCALQSFTCYNIVSLHHQLFAISFI